MSYEVTIGIPVYQAVDYIETTMLSALSQTYGSIEFLVVDDCGNDGTIDIVERLQREHPRGGNIRILHNGRNLGVGPSRNRIIDEARGQYLYFLDSDDVIEPNTIELLVNTMQKNCCDVVYASFERVDNVMHNPTQQYIYPSMVMEHPDDLALYAFRNYGTFQISVCNCLYRLAFLREHGLKFIDTMFWEDMVFTYELVVKVKKAVLLPDITYHYLCRPFSLSNYQDREQIRKEEVQNNMATIDYLKEKCSQQDDRTYTPCMCYNLEKTSLYTICYALKHKERIVPSFSDKELQACMSFPIPFRKLLHFKEQRGNNLMLWFISHLPTPVFIPFVRFFGRKKGIL